VTTRNRVAPFVSNTSTMGFSGLIQHSQVIMTRQALPTVLASVQVLTADPSQLIFKGIWT
jgi:hypothetical protein